MNFAFPLNSAWVYTHCITVYGKYGTIYSVICLHRYHPESVGEVRVP